jgi:hypothetical protein
MPRIIFEDTRKRARAHIHRMMTSRAARRASIATILQAHLAETYLTNRFIISNSTFHDKVMLVLEAYATGGA